MTALMNALEKVITIYIRILLLPLIITVALCQQSSVLAQSPQAMILYPTNGAVNADLSQPVRWTRVANVQAYYLYVGTILGAKDLVDTGETLQTSYLATNLPVGQTVYARLWTKVGGVWRYIDSSFSTAVWPLTRDGGEWAFPRKDPQNTGHQTLPGRIRQPGVAARVYLGGELSQFLSAPLNQNGQLSLITIQGGDVIVYRSDLSQAWAQRGLGALEVVAVNDLDGDGKNEVLAIAPRTLYVFSSEGQLLWTRSFDGVLHSSRIKVASFASGLSGKQIVVWPDRSGYGFAYSFDKGIAAGYQLWMSSYIEEAEIGYPPEVAIADMDLDGSEDIVIATYGRVVVFDGNTGMPISSGGWTGEVRWISGPGINGRNYGTLQIVQFPGNPYPGIVILADAVCLHVAVIENGPAGLKLRYDQFVDYVYPGNGRLLRSTIHSVGDLNGDEHIEIAVNLFNMTGDHRWHLLVVDALQGFDSPKIDLPDAYLWGVQDLAGDGKFNLMVSRETQSSPAASSTLEIYGPEPGGTSYRKIWSLSNARYILNPFETIGPRISTVARNGHTEVLLSEVSVDSASPMFFVENDGRTLGFRFNNGLVSQAWATDRTGLLFFGDLQGQGKTSWLTSTQAGILRLDDAGGNSVQVRLGGLQGLPSVADLDGSGHADILISAYGMVRVFQVDADGSVKERWTQPGNGTRAQSNARKNPAANRVAASVGVIAANFEADSRKSVLITDSLDGHSRLRLLNADGSERWSHVFPELPSNDYEAGIFSWTVGRFVARDSLAIFVSGFLGGWNTEVSRILDGQTGQVLWSQGELDAIGFGPHAGYPAVLSPKVSDSGPAALGKVLLMGKNHLWVNNGVSANLTSYEPNAYYHTPIITDIEGEGSSDIVMAAGYEGLFVLRKDGTELWRRVTVPWDLYSRQPGVADVDGDGVREIGISHKDGLFEAIDALTGSTKWSYGLPAASGNIATCDIAGTGQAQYVLGTTNGELLALNGAANAQSRVLWQLNLHRGLGDVVIADALSTGASQVLVTASDGYLYIIDQASPQTLRAMVRMLQEDHVLADSALADRLLRQADYPTAFKETLSRSKTADLPETARSWLLKSADDVLNASAAARARLH